MDGVVALSLIANVFQVVDFSHQVLTAACEAYKTGVLKENTSLDQIALDLKDANELLEFRLTSNTGQAATKDDQAIIDLAARSSAIAERLLSHTAKVSATHVKGRIFWSICNVFRAVWSRDKISQTFEDLQSLRDEVEYRIIVSLRVAVDSQASVLCGLDARTSAILQAVIDSRSAYGDELGQQTAFIMQRTDLSDHAADRRHKETLAAIRSLSINSQRHLGSVDHSSSKAIQGSNSQEIACALLAWLSFPQMQARRDAISKARRNTFEWIFSDKSVGERTTTGFPEWARSKNGIFWIKGKAGSGKSTLMKLVSEDKRTHRMLSTWAGGKSLIFTSFYFWNQGNQMQKSVLGLLRSLLCDSLKDQPDLIPTAFPNWQPKFADFEPLFEELASALMRLLTCADFRSKICFFIDGLDEFEGDGIETTELCKLLCRIAQTPGVKILVSSRPLLPFEESFQDCSKITLQNLTEGDIRRMTNEKLSSHPRMAKLQEVSPKECQSLVEEITEKSSGVFLWVKLAVNAMLDGLRNHDDMEELFRRLSEIPRELEQLFEFILKRIPHRYLGQAFRLLEIMRRAQCFLLRMDISAVMLSFAENFAKHPAISLPLEPLSKLQIQHLVEDLDAKLKSRCLGLLEIHSMNERGVGVSHVVNFLHKSVPDYLNATRNEILVGHSPNFRVDSAILEGLLAVLKTVRTEGSWIARRKIWKHMWMVMVEAMRFNQLAEESTSCAQSEILEQFDITMGKGHAKIYPGIDRKMEGEHWSTFYPYDGIDTKTRRSWKNDFLSFAIEYGANLYVKKQFSQCAEGLPKKEGRPLLEYAVWPRGSSMITRMLLENGADPNMEFNRGTALLNVLSIMANHAYDGLSSRLHWSYVSSRMHETEFHCQLLDTCEMLLQHGATLHTQRKIKIILVANLDADKSYSAPDVVHGWFQNQDPSQNGTQNTLACPCEIATELRPRVRRLLKRLQKVENPNIGLKDKAIESQTGRRKRVGQWFARAFREDSSTQVHQGREFSSSAMY